MSLFRPDDLDYNAELYESLYSRKKSVLRRFFNYHADQLDERPVDSSAHTQDELCKIVAAKLEEEILEFLDRHERLVEQSVRVDPAINYLAEHYDIAPADLDADNRYELLLILYEEDLLGILDELIIKSRIRSYAATRTYTLNEALVFEELDQRIERFHTKWNKEKEDPDVILVDQEFESDNLVVLKLYQEAGNQSLPTFRFREEDSKEVPVTPEVTRVNYKQLKTIRFQLEQLEDQMRIIFTDTYSGWYRTLDSFFDTVFGVDEFVSEIEEEKSTIAEEIEEEIVESIEDGDDPVERARDKIGEQKSAAESRVDELDVPEERQDDLKNRIQTIEISGSEVVDDQSIETQEFRLIAGLDGLFDSVDIEEGFRDMMKKAESDKQSFVITISNRPVEFSDGTWNKIGAGTLPDKDQRALQIFFDGEERL